MSDVIEVVREGLKKVDDKFTTNMVTLLAEMRAGLAVFSAGAVMKIVA